MNDDDISRTPTLIAAGLTWILWLAAMYGILQLLD